VKKYDVIQHFYEMDLEKTRKKNAWELLNEYLFPKYYEELRQQKKEEIYKKRRERIRKEMEEEEKRWNDRLIHIHLKNDEEDESSSSFTSELPDVENQIPTPSPRENSKTWYDYLSSSFSY
jgi:hypothetical protein